MAEERLIVAIRELDENLTINSVDLGCFSPGKEKIILGGF